MPRRNPRRPGDLPKTIKSPLFWMKIKFLIRNLLISAHVCRHPSVKYLGAIGEINILIYSGSMNPLEEATWTFNYCDRSAAESMSLSLEKMLKKCLKIKNSSEKYLRLHLSTEKSAEPFSYLKLHFPSNRLVECHLHRNKFSINYFFS